MSKEVQTAKEVTIPSLDIVKAEFNLELQKNGFQELQNKVAAIVVTEDNLKEVSELLQRHRDFLKVVEEKHKKAKEPYLEGGRVIDKAKKEYEGVVNGIFANLSTQYKKVCADVAERIRQQEAEAARISTIKSGISANILAFSQRIAAADTLDAIIEIERKINLEKGAPQVKVKFAEFHPEYVEKLTGLSELIKDQKDKVKQLEDIRKKMESTTDEMSILDLQEAADNVQNSMEENKIKVQEEAIDGATSTDVVYAPTVFPSIKARRTVWKYEVVDIKTLHKKMPHLTEVIPNEEAIKALMKSKQTEGSFNGKEEELYFGIRFYKDVTY